MRRSRKHPRAHRFEVGSDVGSEAIETVPVRASARSAAFAALGAPDVTRLIEDLDVAYADHLRHPDALPNALHAAIDGLTFLREVLEIHAGDAAPDGEAGQAEHDDQNESTAALAQDAEASRPIVIETAEDAHHGLFKTAALELSGNQGGAAGFVLPEEEWLKLLRRYVA
jgi:hypothetical protein